MNFVRVGERGVAYPPNKASCTCRRSKAFAALSLTNSPSTIVDFIPTSKGAPCDAVTPRRCLL